MIRTRYRLRALSPGNSTPDSPPVNTVPPQITGTNMIGQLLTTDDGTWTGTPVITFTYQWRRDGVDITGETNDSYTVQVEDAGTDIDCVVTATNSVGSVPAGTNIVSIPFSLSASVASAVIDLDATVAASYPGTGTTWSNLVAAPADGSAQTAYDFFLGNGVATGLPTFTGSAGSPAAYFLQTGSSYFSLKSGANTTFINAMHKTTGGSPWWCVQFWYAPNSASVFPLFATAQNAGTGLMIRNRGSSATPQLSGYHVVSNAFNALPDATATFANSSYGYWIISMNPGTGAIRYWINTTTAENTSDTLTAVTANASNVMRIGSDSAFNPNNTRTVSFAVGNSFLDNTGAAALVAQLTYRHT